MRGKERELLQHERRHLNDPCSESMRVNVPDRENIGMYGLLEANMAARGSEECSRPIR